MKGSIPKSKFMDFKFGQDNVQEGRWLIAYGKSFIQSMHHFMYIGSSVDETGGHGNTNYTETVCSMGTLEEVQWSVV